MMNALMHLNYLAVIVSAIAGFIIGFIWYSKLFGKAWKAEMKITDEQSKDKGGAGGTLVYSFILTLLATIALAMLLSSRHVHSLSHGLLYGLFVGVFFSAVPMKNHALFEKKSSKLYMIDAGYEIVVFAVIGLILGAWH